MPILSVILAFDQIAWLRDAVQSVLDQTFGDFELILIDGTSDASLAELALADRRISYLQGETTRPWRGINLGLDLAKGRYVAFLDANAVFLPRKLERQVGYMEARPDVGLTHTSYQRLAATGEVIDEIRSGAHRVLTSTDCLLNNPIARPTVMIRRDVVDGRLRLEESIYHGEDQILWAEIGRRYDLIGIDESLTRVRVCRDDPGIDPARQIRSEINVVNAPVARNSAAIAALRRSVLSRIYLETGAELWRELGASDIWRLDPAGLEVSASGVTGLDAAGGEEAMGMAPLVAAVAERDAVIRDLHWTLERQAEQFAAERAARSRDEFADRDEALARLHDEVIERDETIALLDGEMTRLHRAIGRRDQVLAPLGVFALLRLARRLRTAAGHLRAKRHPDQRTR